jgi:hypothetical protein
VQPDPNPYSNGVTVYDAVTSTFGTVASTAAVGSGLQMPDGCPQAFGFPFNWHDFRDFLFSPTVS